MRTLVASFMLLATLAPLHAVVAQNAEDEAALRQFVVSFQGAWNARDATALSAFYAADADQVVGNRARVSGQREIERQWAALLSNTAAGVTNTIMVEQIRFLGSDHALVSASGNFAGGRAASGNPLRASSDRALYVMGRDGGSWVLTSFYTYEAVVEPGAAEEVRAARNRFIEAWRRNDASAAAAVFAVDAINMRPDAADDRGRSAIQQMFADFVSGNRIERVEFAESQLTVEPYVAYELGTFEQQFRPQGGASVTQRARYFAVWRREPGGPWEYHRFVFNLLP